MKNNLLKPFIKAIKNQDMSVFPLVFDEFKKLILHYAAKLKYEDATSDLTLFFIELLYDIELNKFLTDDSYSIKRYIAVSIKNKYIALSITKRKIKNYETQMLLEYCGYEKEFDKQLAFMFSLKKLNDMQRFVIIYHYVYGYSIAEIGNYLCISRQAVNKTKNKALEILRKELEIDEDDFIWFKHF